METKLEHLLNSLVKAGWKPFGYIVSNVRSGAYTDRYFFFKNGADGRTLREIVSKESGLWQFVCENGMVEETIRELNTRTKKPYIRKDRIITSKKEYRPEFYEYRLIESALKDEGELEQFLLDNIKVDE